MTLNENWNIIGHEWAVTMLRGRLLRNRVGHAYLITGAEGTGRATLALRLTQAVNCTAPLEHRPCGECRPCQLIARDAHPDVQRITAEGRTIKTQTIRTMQQDLTLQPLEARFKIVLIEDIQKATDNAADALLKTLEEPPSKAKLILTADTRHHVRQTIVSRSQIISLRPVSAVRIEQALIDTTDLPVENAAMVAHLAAGRPGWAFRAVANEDLLDERRDVIEGILEVLYGDRVTRFAYADAIYRKEGLVDLLETWQAWWRDIFLSVEGSHTHPVNADHAEQIQHIASLLTHEEARTALRAIRQTLSIITNTNANKRLALEVMMLNIPYIEQQI